MAEENTAQDYSELDRLAAQAEAEESANESEYIPRDDGREEPGTPPPKADTLEMTQTIVQVGFEVIAARRGEHWRLANEERDNFAYPLAQCVEKYLPQVAVGPELALVMAAGMIALPRLAVDQQKQREAIRRARQAYEQQRAANDDPNE